MKKCLTFLALIASLACTEAQTNLLTNGSFETAPGTSIPDAGAWWNGTHTEILPNTSTTYSSGGWTFGRTNGSGGGIDGPRVHWFTGPQATGTGPTPNPSRPIWTNSPQQGSYAVQLNSDSVTDRVYMEQTLTLAAGYYVLSFWYIDESDEAFTQPVGVDVLVSGSPGTLMNNSYYYTDPDTGADVWQNQQIGFTVTTEAAYTIRFTDHATTNSQQNVTMDNISLTIPEPSAWLSGVLLVGLAVVHYKRRKSLPIS